MSDIRQLEPVQKLARQRAIDVWRANFRRFNDAGWDTVEDPEESPEGFAITVEAQLDILCDLHNHESQDAFARMIGDRLGWGAWEVTRAVESGSALLFALCGRCGVDVTGIELMPNAGVLQILALAVLGSQQDSTGSGCSHGC